MKLRNLELVLIMRMTTFLRTAYAALCLAFCVPSLQARPVARKIITNIVIEGNSLIKTDAIHQRLVYKKGDVFDPDLSSTAIEKLHSLGYFSKIRIEKEEDDDSVTLYFVLQEKKALEGYEIVGNHHVTTKKLVEKLGLKHIPAVDNYDVTYLSSLIRKMYREDNYHKTVVTGVLKPSEASQGVTLELSVEEGPVSQVRQVAFIGVKQIPEWHLRSALLTKELWLLGFADGSGRFNREMLEADKQNIEFAYQNLGFVKARVIDTKIEYPQGDESFIKVTFYIDEGEKYRVRYVMLPYDEEISKQEFLDVITIKEGTLYSRAQALSTVEGIRAVLGKHGYAYAEAYPIPKLIDETKEIDFTFAVEKGEKVRVRRIDIVGNKVTHDKVIRREISLEEGALITSQALASSKRRIEGLGFFERGAVMWKTHKLSEGLVDLELAVTEAKTGNFSLVGGFGGRQGHLSNGLQVGVNVAKRNLFGRGWSGLFDVKFEAGRLGELGLNFYNPYVFDRNLEFNYDSYYRVQEYDQWRASNERPRERVAGGSVGLGFRLPSIDRDLRCQCELGIENNILKNDEKLKLEKEELKKSGNYAVFMLDRIQKTGTLTWLGASLVRDTRNHPIYPTRGGRVIGTSKFAFPILNDSFGFLKLEAVGSWYTPLIGEDDLVLALRARVGMIESFGDISNIPYRELYHMGGQDSIRGFVGGGAGPVLAGRGTLRERNNTPIGARRSVLFNAELQTPMFEAYGMRGRVFYDAGCGWNAGLTDVSTDALPYVKRNDFNIRHAVGFGFSVTKPQQIKIDWGYKLDCDKKFNESPWEVHMSMNMPW